MGNTRGDMHTPAALQTCQGHGDGVGWLLCLECWNGGIQALQEGQTAVGAVNDLLECMELCLGRDEDELTGQDQRRERDR